MDQQLFAQRVLMVYPTNFYFNSSTAQDNTFMNQIQQTPEYINQKAQVEFLAFAELLRNSGIEVIIYDQQSPDQPDAIFPNNWFSTHRNQDFDTGLFILYPMRSPSREAEKNPSLIKEISQGYSLYINIQLQNKALEGTGSIVIDSEERILYINNSERADSELQKQFLQEWNSISKNPYRLVVLNAVDETGKQIYHTNVVLAILKYHIIAWEGLKGQIGDTQKKIIYKKTQEMNNMACNVLMLQQNDQYYLVMSQRARKSLRITILEELASSYKIISPDLEIIETIGGGSARCILAEIF